jgi:hypothetical protein
VVGAYVSAAVVTLVQYLRTHDRRLLLLAFLFGFQAQALAREWYDFWKDVFQVGACALGLLLVLTFSPRHPRPGPGRDSSRPPEAR